MVTKIVFPASPSLPLLCNEFDHERFIFEIGRNISKTSASVSSGFPNTRKLMKARGRRPSAFVVFECLETLMKPEAGVFEIASQSCIINQEQRKNCF